MAEEKKEAVKEEKKTEPKEEKKAEAPKKEKPAERKEDLKVFEVSGEFEEKGGRKKFSKQLKALNENFASEKVMCLLGSKHKIKRRKIYLNEVKEIKEEGK